MNTSLLITQRFSLIGKRNLFETMASKDKPPSQSQSQSQLERQTAFREKYLMEEQLVLLDQQRKRIQFEKDIQDKQAELVALQNAKLRQEHLDAIALQEMRLKAEIEFSKIQ